MSTLQFLTKVQAQLGYDLRHESKSTSEWLKRNKISTQHVTFMYIITLGREYGAGSGAEPAPYTMDGGC